jgi:hypothetical protein
MNKEINLRDYEIVPSVLPRNLTPREFVLEMTGKDIDTLKHPTEDRDFTWGEIKRVGADKVILNIIMTGSRPSIVLRKKVV